MNFHFNMQNALQYFKPFALASLGAGAQSQRMQSLATTVHTKCLHKNIGKHNRPDLLKQMNKIQVILCYGTLALQVCMSTQMCTHIVFALFV